MNIEDNVIKVRNGKAVYIYVSGAIMDKEIQRYKDRKNSKINNHCSCGFGMLSNSFQYSCFVFHVNDHYNMYNIIHLGS